MNIGISSACFYPLDTAESLKKCADGGFHTAEIFINTHSELFGAYFENLKSIVRENGMKIISVHPFTSGCENVLFFSGYEKRIEDGIEYYKNYFEFAAQLGAKYIVFHGNNMKSKFCGFEKYADTFRRINLAAKEFGVELIHENTTWCIARDAEGIKGLLAACPEMRFVFDAKQACRGGCDPYAVIKAMGGNIAHVHINDWADGKCLPPCFGSLDLDFIFDHLKTHGYEGDAVVEVYRENFDDIDSLSLSAEKLAALCGKYFEISK